jgi:UDP-N-acetylmuramoyl-tripeptide--D-alanyl-D-alanine ligase
MSYWLINIIFVLFLMYFIRTNRHGLHMLQLEHYYKDRYLKWMKENSKEIFRKNRIILLILTSIVLIMDAKIGAILSIACYLVFNLVFYRKKEKKAFVVTARVKRQFLTYLILIVLMGVMVNVFNDVYSIIVLNIFGMIPYVFVYLVALINTPFEKAINNKFCKKASEKLKSIPDFKVIGVTGSYGKTSTKYIINTIISQKYNTLMTPESYNTTMGVVRTVNEKLKPIHQAFLCEMGAKYIGDIKEICDIVHPSFRSYNSCWSTTFRYI